VYWKDMRLRRYALRHYENSRKQGSRRDIIFAHYFTSFASSIVRH